MPAFYVQEFMKFILRELHQKEKSNDALKQRMPLTLPPAPPLIGNRMRQGIPSASQPRAHVSPE
jgi:hypothetical protein